MPKRKKRRRQRGTYAEKLAIFLDWAVGVGGPEEATTALGRWETREDLEASFGGVFAEDGLLEVGPERMDGFRPRELCWLWKGNAAGGRPRMSVDGKLVFVTRWVYARVYGTPPLNTVVRQRCGQSTCIRPNHLVLMPRSAPPYMAKRQQKREAARDED